MDKWCIRAMRRTLDGHPAKRRTSFSDVMPLERAHQTRYRIMAISYSLSDCTNKWNGVFGHENPGKEGKLKAIFDGTSPTAASTAAATLQ